jgi:hypothetical protein
MHWIFFLRHKLLHLDTATVCVNIPTVVHFSEGQNFQTLRGGLAKHTPCAHNSYKPIPSVFETIEKE